MNDFLQYLANKKSRYYYDLHVKKGDVRDLNQHDAASRMIQHWKYIEICGVVDALPLKEKRRFDDMYEEELRILRGEYDV